MGYYDRHEVERALKALGIELVDESEYADVAARLSAILERVARLIDRLGAGQAGTPEAPRDPTH